MSTVAYDKDLWAFISRAELIMQAGVGLSTGQGSDPQVMMRLSRDGGQTWGTELVMGVGKMGEYKARAFANRLGRGRNFVVELSTSDPVFTSWISFVIDVERGSS